MLLFNHDSRSGISEVIEISIHLMLLFNRLYSRGTVADAHFNTSNVTIQRYYIIKLSLYFHISIHLMLLFNQSPKNLTVSGLNISIHLMLLFNVLNS